MKKKISLPLNGHKFVDGHKLYRELKHGGVEIKTIDRAFKYGKKIVFINKNTIYHFWIHFNTLTKKGVVKKTNDETKWIWDVEKPKNMNTLFGKAET